MNPKTYPYSLKQSDIRHNTKYNQVLYYKKITTDAYTAAPSPSDTHSATAYNSAYSDTKSLHQQNTQSLKSARFESLYSKAPDYSGFSEQTDIHR